MIEKHHPLLSIQHQCQLLSIYRSGVYYKPAPVNSRKLIIRKEIKILLSKKSDSSIRSITKQLKDSGHEVGRKLVTSIYTELKLKNS